MNSLLRCFRNFKLSPLNNDQYDLTARISNVELNYVGQAYRLGRYAIHFHLLGDMTGSYVRSCAIHRSFNRAVNIHGTHNVMIEHNVAYHIMGGEWLLFCCSLSKYEAYTGHHIINASANVKASVHDEQLVVSIHTVVAV